MWCVANEPMGGPLLGAAPPVPAAVEAGTKFFRELYDEARRLDATRPVTLVGVQGGPTRLARPLRRRLHQPLLRLVRAGRAARRGGSRRWRASWTRCTRRSASRS